MPKKTISEIIKEASELRTRQEKIDFLRQYDSSALRIVLQYALDSNIKFLLPEGEPPYKPNEYDESRYWLYSEARKLYLFVEGGNDNLKPNRREMLFVSFLESIDPEDAKLILSVKDKKLPVKGITPKLVNEAFGDLVNL